VPTTRVDRLREQTDTHILPESRRESHQYGEEDVIRVCTLSTQTYAEAPVTGVDQLLLESDDTRSACKLRYQKGSLSCEREIAWPAACGVTFKRCEEVYIHNGARQHTRYANSRSPRSGAQ